MPPKLPPLRADCWQTDPAQSQLREQMEDALRLAERFTRRYDDLLRAFQAEMLNTTSLLDQLNSQFGWVSRLTNITQGTDGFLQVTTVSPTGAAARSQGSSPVPLSPGRAGGHGKWVRGRKKRLCARPAASRHNSRLRGRVPGPGAGTGANPAFPALSPPSPGPLQGSQPRRPLVPPRHAGDGAALRFGAAVPHRARGHLLGGPPLHGDRGRAGASALQAKYHVSVGPPPPPPSPWTGLGFWGVHTTAHPPPFFTPAESSRVLLPIAAAAPVPQAPSAGPALCRGGLNAAATALPPATAAAGVPRRAPNKQKIKVESNTPTVLSSASLGRDPPSK